MKARSATVAASATKRYALVGFVALVVAAAAYLLFFRASDEKQIREALSHLSEAVRLERGDTNPLVRLARLNGRFRDIFEKDVRASIPELSGAERVTGRSALAELAAQAPMAYQTLDVGFGAVDIRLDGAKRSAQVKTTATLSAADATSSGTARRETRAVDFFFVRAGAGGDGDWQIQTVTVWDKKDGS